MPRAPPARATEHQHNGHQVEILGLDGAGEVDEARILGRRVDDEIRGLGDGRVDHAAERARPPPSTMRLLVRSTVPEASAPQVTPDEVDVKTVVSMPALVEPAGWTTVSERGQEEDDG